MADSQRFIGPFIPRFYLGPEATYEQAEAFFALFWPEGFVTLDITGLPDKFTESLFFQTVLRLWKACYEKHAATSKDEILFEQFLQGEVISWQEADWIISLFVKICFSLPLKEQGWYSLSCLVLFMNQHGRLSQAWGVYIQRWLEHQLNQAKIPEPDAAPAAYGEPEGLHAGMAQGAEKPLFVNQAAIERQLQPQEVEAFREAKRREGIQLVSDLEEEEAAKAARERKAEEEAHAEKEREEKQQVEAAEKLVLEVKQAAPDSEEFCEGRISLLFGRNLQGVPISGKIEWELDTSAESAEGEEETPGIHEEKSESFWQKHP
jgi:hypothetical protein